MSTIDEVSNILQEWARAETPAPDAKQRERFARFATWCDLYDFPKPANGEAIGEYLLDMMTDGASLSEIRETAAAIELCYANYGALLDRRPVRGALAVCAAQLSPNRTIN
jgi:hypothetical protein